MYDYVNGYVVSILHRKLRHSMSKTHFQEPYSSILETCKHNVVLFVLKLNFVIKDMSIYETVVVCGKSILLVLTFFSIAECYLQSVTKSFISLIDARKIVATILKDPP